MNSGDPADFGHLLGSSGVVFPPQCKLRVKYLQSGSQRDAVHLLVLLLKDVCGLLKLMFSYTLDESSFVTLQQRHSRFNSKHISR
ncbi:hypothetical protein EYF80_055025 [Liparis tanakae]|uniref:Uncharacterized protein n=1 Tax=Liparis tanakae TaxID=230148 RepID=A0A4Z2F2T5_9TELE|nr:hypothetical protein EYF80_055025 [Liparis tanakae]